MRLVAHDPMQHPFDSRAIWARSIDSMRVEHALRVPGPTKGVLWRQYLVLRHLCSRGLVTVIDHDGAPIHGPGSPEFESADHRIDRLKQHQLRFAALARGKIVWIKNGQPYTLTRQGERQLTGEGDRDAPTQ